MAAILAAAPVLPSGAPRAETGARAPITLFAAASTLDAINAAARAFESAGGTPVRGVYAASSTLARQIARGAPADLFLSANVAWMGELMRSGKVDAATRVDLLGNRLVLIAPKDSPMRLDIAPGFALAEALGGGRLALGDPGHAPAGIYAKAALEFLGVWQEVAGRAAYLGDVRSALALVARGEAAAGIVYASDAPIAPGVRVVDTFPRDSHPPIVYPLAVVAGRATPAVLAFYRFLQGPRAGALFRTHGFSLADAED